MSAIIVMNNREMESVMSGNLDELEPLAVDLRRQRQFKDNLLRVQNPRSGPRLLKTSGTATFENHPNLPPLLESTQPDPTTTP
jgi:hypothetical protein